MASSATARARLARPVSFGLGRHLATRQARHFFQATQGCTCLGDGGARLLNLGVRGRQAGLRAQDLIAQFGGVQLHQHLALLDLVVDVDVDLQHRAGKLAADVDGTGGLHRAVGGDV